MKEKYLLSICIPSYNRDIELKRLLNSIDVCEKNYNDLEIVIREDFSPKRKEIAQVVSDYKNTSPYAINYIENEENYGYDKNLRSVAKSAEGEYVIFMGDDDVFVSGALDKFMDFLRENKNIGYILRRYQKIHYYGSFEDYRYAQDNVFFEAGKDAIIELFRRSVFISGFTFKKSFFNDYDCADYDGSLLFQLYILACVCNSYPSCYCDIAITKMLEQKEKTPYFGKSNAEKGLYESGKSTFNNSLNFLKHVQILCKDIDKKLNIKITDDIMTSYSKYSYGFLCEHRNDGIKIFRQYARELKKLGFAKTYHFYIYYFALLFLGKINCEKIIMAIKKRKGSTPRL